MKPNGESKMRSLDDFCVLGKYCLLVMIMAEFLALASLSSMTFMMYAGASPTVTSCGNYTSDNMCAELSSLIQNTSCVPQLKYDFKSVNVEFNYLCTDGHYVKNSISIEMLGVLIGAASFGQISDLFGRRKAMLVTSFGMSLFCFVTGFAANLFQFTVLRTINGFFTGGLVAVQSVYIIENIPLKHRLWMQTVVTWSPNFIIYPFMAYLANDWRTLTKMAGIIGAIATVIIFFLFESSRWLIQRGKIAEAKEIMKKIQRIDGVVDESYDEDLDKILLKEKEASRERAAVIEYAAPIYRDLFEERNANRRRYTFIHLFCTWEMVAWTTTLVTGITVTALINYALMYNLENLSGSIFWNSAIFGIVRWATNIIVAVVDYTVPAFGRRLIMQCATLSTSLSLASMTALYYIGDAHAGGLFIRVGTIMAMSMCSQLFLAKYMVVNELYPTAIRNLAVSAVSTTSRIGTIFAPQLFYLNAFGAWMPYLVLTILSLADYLAFAFFIPETKGRKLDNYLPPKENRILYKRKDNNEMLLLK